MGRQKSFCEAEVLEKALQLFHKNGYENVSVRDLVNSLNISKSSLYDTYGSKQDLFLKVLKHYRQHYANEALQSLDQADNGMHSLETFLTNSLETACNDEDKKGCLMINSILEASKYEVPSVSEILHENKKIVLRKLRQAIQLGQQQGEIKDELDPVSTAEMLYALQSGLIANSRLDKDPESLKQALRIGLELIRA